MIKRTYNIGKELVAACNMLDINPNQVLKKIGLDKFSGNYELLTVTPKQITAVYEALETESGKDDFYILLSEGFAKAPLSNIVLAMQASETLLDGIGRVGFFKEQFEPVEWRLSKSKESLLINVKSLTPDYLFGVKQQVVTFLTLVLLCRNVTTKHIIPKRFCVTDVFPYQERIEQQMGCSIEVASNAMIEFDKKDMDIQTLSANKYIANGLDAIIGIQTYPDTSSQSFIELVYTKVLEFLPSADLTSDRLAKHFFMSKRTFERRLSQQGTNFTKIVRNCRLRMAKHYLTQTHLPLIEIGFLLGFQEKTSFYRACKCWFGSTPQKLRDQTSSQDKR